ncbi:hypothetical protein H0X32_03490 [Patescibacteria group bacterium]|nr:hypothetical protein [Patescibacteria group bacterium]
MAHNYPLLLTLFAFVLGGLIALGLGLPFILRELADGDILFTTVQEGTAKAIMRGEDFDHFVMAFKNYHLNDPRKKRLHDPRKPDWEVLPDTESAEHYDDRHPLVRWLGLHWVGIPNLRTVYTYPFEWKEFSVNSAGDECVKSRKERTNFIYVKDFPYAIQMRSIKTIDPLPVDVTYLLTTWTNNPYRALFKTEDWLKQVTAGSDRRGRDFIGSRTFSMINSELGATSGSPGDHPDVTRNFSTPIIQLTGKLPDDGEGVSSGLAERYGTSIRTADLLDVDLTGAAAAEHERTTLDRYTSEQEALATQNRGKADAYVILKKGKAEAKSLAARLKVMEAHGETGALLAQLDAMQANGEGKTIIWANNPLISQTGLAPLLNSLGITTPEAFKKLLEDK